MLLRAEDQVGHGARAVSRMAELAGDTLAFAARHTGLRCEAQALKRKDAPGVWPVSRRNAATNALGVS